MQMELPELMSLQAASPAKTYPKQATSAELVKGHEAGYIKRSLDFIASYDPLTSSWKTSQHSLVAQGNDLGGGLAEYLATWPNSGLMRNGKTYRRGTWASRTIGSVSGLLPTPLKSDMQASFSAGTVRRVMKRAKQEHLCYRPIVMGWDRHQIVTLYERVMGFPTSWVASMLSETP